MLKSSGSSYLISGPIVRLARGVCELPRELGARARHERGLERTLEGFALGTQPLRSTSTHTHTGFDTTHPGHKSCVPTVCSYKHAWGFWVCSTDGHSPHQAFRHKKRHTPRHRCSPFEGGRGLQRARPRVPTGSNSEECKAQGTASDHQGNKPPDGPRSNTAPHPKGRGGRLRGVTDTETSILPRGSRKCNVRSKV